LISSITRSSTSETDHASAFAVISSNSFSRFFSLSFFESFSPSMTIPAGRMTAAAHTGPATGPRPASSTPHTEP
jgi:hypothetical protein